MGTASENAVGQWPLAKTPADFHVRDEGTLGLLWPNTDAAHAWVDEHLYCDADEEPLTWFAGAIVIEHRFLRDIVQGIARDELTLAVV